MVRKKLYKYVTFVLVFLACNNVIASESIKAIKEVSKELGIKLTESAKKNIGISTVALDESMTLPKTSIIHSRDKVGVYIFRNDWYRFQEVDQVNTDSYRLKRNTFLKGDQLVVEGVALLRVSEMEAFATEE